MTACLSLLLLFTACDEMGPEALMAAEPSYAVVESTVFAIKPQTFTLDTIDQRLRLRAERLDGSGRTVSVTWSTSNSAIATINSYGTIRARGHGTATVTARSSSYGTATATVTVGPSTTPPPPPPPPPTPTGVATVAVTPATVSVSAGATTQLTAVFKDANGTTVTGVAFTWASANAAVATVSTSGLVKGVASGQVAIAATGNGKTGSALVTVTGTAPPPPPPTSSAGIWIGKAELNAIAMGSNGWTGTGELKATADAVWTPQPIELQSGQTFNVQVMAGALVYARLAPDPSANAYRAKVAGALRQIMAFPDDLTQSTTAPTRNLGAYPIAADLIDLKAYDPALDTQFRAWLTRKLDAKYASSQPSIRVAAWDRPNNIGAYARFSLAAASAYLGDRATLDKLALVMRRWLGNTSINHQFNWDSDQSWQMNPSSPSTFVGVGRKGAIRDGHNFDGLQPEDQRRATPTSYTAASFPNNYSEVRYNEIALEAHLPTVLILHRAGYTDLVNASDQALLRAAKWIKWAADNHSALGYRYFTDSKEVSRPLINYLYRAGLPETRARNQMNGRGYGFSWTYWTHGGRSL